MFCQECSIGEVNLLNDNGLERLLEGYNMCPEVHGNFLDI